MYTICLYGKMEKIKIKSSKKIHKEDIQEQILDAAEVLFSEKGFSNTSIRDITEKANCNLAAVNYHFHGKKNLYVNVFRRRMSFLAEQRISRLEKKFSEKDFQMNLESLIYSSRRNMDLLRRHTLYSLLLLSFD